MNMCVFLDDERKSLTALIVLHVRLMRRPVLGLPSLPGQALASDLEDKPLLDVERGLKNGKIR